MQNIVYTYKKLRKARDTLAVFDIDWTLIKPKEGRKFPVDKEDWQWLRDSVPTVLKRYFRNGYQIVFLTDQSKAWKVDMIKDMISKLDIPVTCLIAMQKEDHKPNPRFFQSIFEHKIYDISKSLFVGDAAGREGDWSDKDKVIANKLGIPFYTPEEIFPLPKTKSKKLDLTSPYKEVVIMIGYPGSGKSTIAKEYLESKGYVRIDGDIFKTPQKMIQEAEKYIANQSVIFDATNGTKEKRNYFIEFAKKHNLPVKCIWKTTDINSAMEQNRERQKKGGPKIPDVVFYVYRKNFQEPTPDECNLLLKID